MNARRRVFHHFPRVLMLIAIFATLPGVAAGQSGTRQGGRTIGAGQVTEIIMRTIGAGQVIEIIKRMRSNPFPFEKR